MAGSVRAVTAALLLVLVASSASAAPDRTVLIQAGESFTWNGIDTVGLNLRYGTLVDELPGDRRCGKEVTTYCEATLATLSNPVPDHDADGVLSRGVTVTIEAKNAVSDYDLYVFASDDQGSRGAEIARSTAAIDTSTTETVQFPVRTTRANPFAYVYIEVVYFAAVGGYSGSVAF